MEAAESSLLSQAFRVAVQLLPFWDERPAVWFIKAEAQFILAGISSEKIKFCQVFSQLDHRYVMEVENIITFLPDEYPYTTLKTQLTRRLSLREQHICQLLRLEMGDRKPSQFLRHLRDLAPEVPDDFLRDI